STLIEEEPLVEEIDPGSDEGFEDPGFGLTPEFEEGEEGEVFNLEEFYKELNEEDEGEDEEQFDEEFNLEGLDQLSFNKLRSGEFETSMKIYYDNQGFWGQPVVTLIVEGPGA
ncbi:MAG: hypothetical protein JKY89_08175, partial [Immundisolibacteraceae bacterium]|nr:hypothetical protein [Immundisolibacteraceae bacterium]